MCDDCGDPNSHCANVRLRISYDEHGKVGNNNSVTRRKKLPEFSKFSRAINLHFNRLSRQKNNNCNNDLSQGQFQINTQQKGHPSTFWPGQKCMRLFIWSPALSLDSSFTQRCEWQTKIFCLLQFSLMLHRIPTWLPEFAMFREFSEYSKYMYVAILNKDIIDRNFYGLLNTIRWRYLNLCCKTW